MFFGPQVQASLVVEIAVDCVELLLYMNCSESEGRTREYTTKSAHAIHVQHIPKRVVARVDEFNLMIPSIKGYA